MFEQCDGELEPHIQHHTAHPIPVPIPIPIPLYVGIAISHSEHNGKSRFGIYVHDGFWSYDYYKENGTENEPEKMYRSIINFISKYQKEKQCKIVIAGLVNGESSLLFNLGKRLWFELDIVPCILQASGSSLDEKACSAARKANLYVSPTGMPGLCKISVGYRHEVEVDCNGKLSFCSLEDYEKHFTKDTWKELMETSQKVKELGKSIVFFNSTPQGGGVAIIRHSTIRIFKLLGIDAHWFVMKPNPEVFEITKKKFHNVLQGVAPKDTVLTEEEKSLYEQWCEGNLSSYWDYDESPVKKADVIVIDDPQPSGMIARLKKLNDKAVFVYRSHIQIRSDLTKHEGTVQRQVWKYLWNNIQHCDVFVSHPIDEFIPSEVFESNMIIHKMPAVTDPCDGLNKPLDPFSQRYYQLMFNRTAFDQGQNKVDFDRPYYIQIARFDPSKGIPDLIEAYLRLRESLVDLESGSSQENDSIPQLVITGHGSIDDPEASFIHRNIMHQLQEACDANDGKRAEFVEDIIVVRLGPSDQMLNAVLAGATCAFQLSLREGFEVKVSEALIKGVPVIAYASGGIPLQIRDNDDGHLLETGDIDAVAKMMKRLYTDKDHLKLLQNGAQKNNREWILTPSNCLQWNKIMLRCEELHNRHQE